MLSTTSIKGRGQFHSPSWVHFHWWHPCIGPIWYPSNACETCRDRLEGQRVTMEKERERERERERRREREVGWGGKYVAKRYK